MNKKNIKVLAGLGFVHLALLSVNAFSQEKTNQLDEVVVTASRSPRKQSETGKVVRVISSEQLAQSQGRTLPELLNNVAGLSIGGNGNNPGDIKAVYLRGASAGNTLILIDGVAVNDASSPSGEYDIAAIAIDQVERIEILKGGNSTLYGSDAVAGVINIITKKGSGKLTPNVLATAGSYGTFKQALALNGDIGDTRIALNISNLSSDGFSSSSSEKSSTPFENDGFKQQGISLNLRQTVSPGFKLSANIQSNLNRADLDDGYYADNKEFTYKKSNSLMGLGAQIIAGKAVIDANLNQNNVDTKFLYYGDLSHLIGKITNLDANVSYPLASYVDLIAGFNYKLSATQQYSSYGNVIGDNNLKSFYSSFFFKLGDNWRTELGGRINDHSVYGRNFTYTINPSYLIANRYKLFINLSSAYKVPSLYQLFSEYGNLALKPESTNTFEAGADMDLISNKLRLNFAYFSRNISDVIGNGIVDQKYVYVNKDQQKDNGLELEVSYKPESKINIDAYYAYVTGKIIKDGQSSNNLFRRPKHSMGLNVSRTFSKRFQASLNYKFVGKRVDEYYDPLANQSVSANLAAYSLVDLYLQVQPKANLNLFLDLKNLLNKNYVDFIGYTTKGINFSAGFKLDVK